MTGRRHPGGVGNASDDDDIVSTGWQIRSVDGHGREMYCASRLQGMRMSPPRHNGQPQGGLCSCQIYPDRMQSGMRVPICCGSERYPNLAMVGGAGRTPHIRSHGKVRGVLGTAGQVGNEHETVDGDGPASRVFKHDGSLAAGHAAPPFPHIPRPGGFDVVHDACGAADVNGKRIPAAVSTVGITTDPHGVGYRRQVYDCAHAGSGMVAPEGCAPAQSARRRSFRVAEFRGHGPGREAGNGFEVLRFHPHDAGRRFTSGDHM